MKRIPPSVALFLILLGAPLLLSFGTPLAVYLYTLNEVVGFIVLRVFQAAGLLLLLASLGCALGAAADGRRGQPYILMLYAALAHLFGSLMGLIWQALFLRIAVSAEELALLFGSLLDSAVIPLFLTYIIVYFVFLAKGKADAPWSYLDLSSPVVHSALLASGIFFVYRLIGQISTTVEFVKAALGFEFLKTEEKLLIILDYVPVIAVAILGYFLLLRARALYLAAAKRHRAYTSQ